MPGIYFDAFLPYQVRYGTVDGVSVRGYCGGDAPAIGSSGEGAVLSVWSTGDDAHAPGWVDLDSTSVSLGSGTPAIPENAAPAAWTAPDAKTAAALVQQRDIRITFGCRAKGGSTVEKPASVGMSHLEVHVKYTVASNPVVETER